LSKYTIQLKNLIDSNYPIFDFDYPIFDPVYKPVLEQKILDWYLLREIGLETPAQFKHFLKSKMNVIMPYYNEFYSSQEVFKTYDPYKNKNVTTTDTRTSTSNSSGKSDSAHSNTSSGTNTSKETFSDTPQAKLSGLDYATNYTENTADTGGTDTGTGTITNTGTITSTDEYVSTIAGHDGMKYPTDILMGLRNTFINIDQMIIEELSVLFLNIA
jgi:hypothetical protein